MSRLLRWLSCGLGFVLVLGMCASSNAALNPIYIPYTPGVTASYGNGPGDYESRPDAYGTPTNNLLGATVPQGGSSVGLGVNRIGLGQLITPQTGSTYGAPNNHSLTVNTITIPLRNNYSGPLTLTFSITPGQLVDSSTLNPLPPNDPRGYDSPSAAIWTPSSSAIYTNTFTLTGANPQLTFLDLAGANLADPGNNPAPPQLLLNQTYLVGLEWAWSSFSDNQDLVWYRGTQVDAGGQIMVEENQSRGFQTFATANFATIAPRTAALAINAPVPEPSTLVLLGLAVPALAASALTRAARKR